MNEKLFTLYGVDLTPEQMNRELQSLNINANIGESELEAILLQRVSKLSELVHEKKDIQDGDPEDLIAHLTLRMISASEDVGNIETWFLNNEGAALRRKLERIRNMNSQFFLELLRKLLFTKMVMYLGDFADELEYAGIDRSKLYQAIGIGRSSLNDQMYIAVHWEAVPSAVKDDKCLLFQGYAVLEIQNSSLIAQAMKNYSMLLRMKINELSKTMTVEQINDFQRMAEKIYEAIKSTSTSFIGIEHLEEETVYFPPCMRAIDWSIYNGIELERTEYLQMGFFLREAGMSINDYLRYWYLRHPRNVGVSWDEFLSSHWGRYELPHHYGEIGGGKKYSSFGCKKIQSQGLCPFKDWMKERLENFLMPYLDGIYTTPEEKQYLENEIQHIHALCRKRHFGAGCSTEFKLRFKVHKADYVNHPIHSYYNKAKLISRPPKNKADQETENATDHQSESNQSLSNVS